MKKINEAVMLSPGNATSLMVFIDLAYYVEKQRGMLSLAFPSIGTRGLYKMLSGFGSSEVYTQNKDQMLGMSERFYNNSGLKVLYKTLAQLVSQQVAPEGEAGRTQDINRVLSKIERMINSKLTNEEKDLFSSLEDTLDNYSDNLNSSLDSSMQSTIAPEEPAEEPTEEPEEAPAKVPTEKPEETPTEEPKSEEEPTEKPKTEEQFKSLIKRLVKETLRGYEKKFGKL